MTIVQLMAQLRASGVKLSWQGEQLKCQLPKGGISEALKQQLVANKEQVKAFVKRQQQGAQFGEIKAQGLLEAPLSNAQASIWFVDFMQGGSPQFNLPAAFAVTGDFNLTVAQQALGTIIERHQALRSVFVQKDQTPVQQVKTDYRFELAHYDLSDLDEVQANEQGRQIALADRDKPFDLANDLLLRAGYVRLPNKDGAPYGLMFINVHHIVSDGWSMGVLTQEFIALYHAFSHQQANPLPALPIQYSDYVMWQRDKLGVEQIKADLDYWQQLLGDAPACHQLPLDRPRVDAPVKGGIVRSEVPQALCFELKQLAKASDATLFMLLQGAFALHIGRLSSETDVVLGAPNAGRLNQTLESMIGMFVNTQVFRSEFDDNPSFVELLLRTKAQHLATAQMQHVSFEAIVEHLQPVRVNHAAPLFQILLNFDNAEHGPTEIEGLHFAPLEGSDDIDNKYDITLYIFEHSVEGGSTLSFKWVYDARLFNHSTVAMFSREFDHLLQQLVLAPEQPVLSHSWAKLPSAALPAPQAGSAKPLMALFEQRAMQHPDAPALSFDAENYSYGELGDKVNQMAYVLQQHYGVKVASRVAIAIERSATRVIAILAVMKLGGCYIPISDEIPRSRAQKMLSLCAPECVLTTDAQIAELSAQASDASCFVDVTTTLFSQLLSAAPVTNLPLVQLADDAVIHIIFTSGSTGEPKGVLGTYGALANRIDWMLRAQPFAAGETMAHITSMAFIRAVWELFTPLCGGARLLLCARDMVRQADVLWPYLAKQQVTRMVSAPSLMKSLHQLHLMTPQTQKVSLTHWYVSGEPLLLADAQAVLTSFGELKLFNMYGASEVMSAVTCGEIAMSGRGLFASVGTPIDGVTMVIENDQGQPVPQGVIGEIVIYGVTVASGYLQQDIANSGFFYRNEQRGFRSGDYGRLLEGGAIECLGRRDDQVKLRGFRIELAEIEHCLNGHELVQSAKVLNIGDKAQPVLAAYVVIGQNDPDSAKSQISAFIKQQLPSYMVPALVVTLDKWPLKANGKIDRSALPKTIGAQNKQALVKPSGQTQCKLAKLWRELLHIDATALGADQRFFELGGHSLLLVSLQGLVRREFAVEVSVKSLFQFDTIELLAAHIDKLQQDGHSNKVPEVVPVSFEPVEERGVKQVPLSFAQQRLWLVDKIQQGSPQYNMPRAFMVKGALDLDALTVAIERIIKRHQTIRTRYVEQGDSAVSLVYQDFDFSLYLQDLTGLEAQQRESKLKQLIVEDAEASFDLSNDLMLRVSVVQLSHTPQTACIIFNQHHIASDGWSLNLLCQEFVAQYQAAVKGASDPLEPLKLQYSDYAYWQRQWLGTDLLAGQLEYWLGQLDQLPQCHTLPLDFPRPKVKGHHGLKHTVQLGPDFAKTLEQLAAQYRLTPFMLLHGALALVLGNNSYSQDIVIGTPVANRQQPELAELMGFFVNTLVLRVSLEHSDLAAYLDHVREVNLAALDNQDLPFDYLVEQLKLTRSRAHTPLFQILFTLNTFADVGLEIDGLEIEQLDDSEVAVKFDLDINAQLNEQGLILNWVYDSELFTPDSIEALCGQLLSLLKKMSESAEHSWQALATQSYDQRAQAIAKGPQVCYPATPVHRLFEQQAQLMPQQIAVQFEADQAHSLSYEQLNQQANRLAHFLTHSLPHSLSHSLPQQQGPNAGRIALCFERSVNMVVAILAVLKAGGAYVPIDPSLPAARRDFLLADSGAKVLLSESQFIDLFAPSDCELVALDGLALETFDCDNLSNNAGENPTDLAYVIYTSGSTGKPKGVMMGHGGLTNRLAWMHSAYGLSAQDKVLQKTPYGFDVSVWEFLWTLGYGATLVLAKPEGHKDPQYLSALIAEAKVSVLHFVPSMLSTYLAQPNSHFAPSVRLLFCSGEALMPSEVHALKHKAPHVALHNLYGPTEAAIDVSYFDCQSLGQMDVLPIGRAIDNVELLVLDKQQNLAPMGAIGELYIGGVALAQGYLNRPELTAQSFIDHPFAQGAKLYRTGDLVKLVAGQDGEAPLLVYLGRADSQLKIRGFRIELGEIEQQLRALRLVDSAQVLALEVAGEKALVAYVKAVEETAKDELQSQLKAALADALPHYMCPEHYVFVEQWPLTHNGKLDRKALPLPDVSASQGQYIKPVSEIEITLAAIWAELLGIDGQQVGLNANFFALGGHSLLAARMVAQVRLQCEVEIPLAAVFDHPSLGALAKVIEHSDKAANAQGMIPADEALHQLGAVAPASFAQQRLWFIQQLDLQSSEYHIPAAMRLIGEFDLALAKRAMQAIVSRHLSLRTAFFQQDDVVMQRIVSADDFALSVVDLSGATGTEQQAEADNTIAALIRAPFDLSQGQLIRACFIRLGDNEGILALCVHHIAADGWSMSNLSDEFVSLYQSYSKGLAEGVEVLVPLNVQYIDFAQQQRQWLDDQGFADARQYWVDLLKVAPASHQLPLDRPRALKTAPKPEQIERVIQGGALKAIEQLLSQSNTTLFMLMQCALALHIGRMSGQQDVVIGAPNGGRDNPALEPLIGLFLNTQVYRSEFSDNPSFNALLLQTKNQHLTSDSHKQVPFEAIVEAVNPPRALNMTPIFQVLLNHVNFSAASKALDGLSIEPLATPLQNKYDLTLYLQSLEQQDGQPALAMNYVYDGALFDQSTMLGFATEFEFLLSQLVAAPQLPVLNHPWQTPTEVIAGKTIELSTGSPATLFEQQVESTPDAIAYVDGSVEMSFTELNHMANRLSQLMACDFAIKQGDCVAVATLRSVNHVAATLALAKLGACYMPLTDELPEGRLGYMLEAAQVKLVVTEQGFLPQSDVLAPFTQLLIDSEEVVQKLTLQSPVNPEPACLQADTPAYVIFTSGTTGMPKAVQGNYQALTNRIEWMNNSLGFSGEDPAMCHITAFGFIRSVWELLTPLCCGVRLVMCQRDLLLQPLAFAEFLAQHKVSAMVSAPSLLSALLSAELDVANWPVKQWFVSGEPLVNSLANAACRHFSETRFYNLYGSTEVMSDVLYHRVELTQVELTQVELTQSVDDKAQVSIGLPIDNVAVAVLGPDLQPVPVGVCGELVILGDALANGYLYEGQAKTLDGKFVMTAHGRGYRTGDLAKLGSDGLLYCLGRMDDQVQIRGHRVELAEIEHQLLKLDQIKAVKVVALENHLAELNLVAYVVPLEPQQQIDPQLQGHIAAALQQDLPSYMLPSQFVLLEQLPLRPNGKVDKSQLPAVDWAAQTTPYVAPETEIETSLCEIWAELLQLDVQSISRDADFFALGGHSLLTIKLISAIKAAFDVEPQVATVFEHKTLCALAQSIEQAILVKQSEAIHSDTEVEEGWL